MAVLASAGAASACGSGSGSTDTGSSAATSATSATAVSSPAAAPAGSGASSAPAAAALTQDQLAAAALTTADSAALKPDTSMDGTGVQTDEMKALTGGAACTEYLNAVNAYAGSYGSVAEVDKGYTVSTTGGTLEALVTLISHTSAASAQRVVDDVKDSASKCKHLTTDDDGEAEQMNLAPQALPTIGDSSTAVRDGMVEGKNGYCLTMGVVRVGTVTLHVAVMAPDGYYYQVLQQVEESAVKKLQATGV